jgi:ferritin-like metal-binding protein YciE
MRLRAVPAGGRPGRVVALAQARGQFRPGLDRGGPGHRRTEEPPGSAGRCRAVHTGPTSINGTEERTMAVKTLHDLFVHTLGDIYYAENQILKALPKMAQQATSDDLREAFDQHLEETRGQVQRLEQVFQLVQQPAKGEKCDAIEGIIKEADGLIQDIEDPEVRDAGMLAAAQAVEHYEISRYGTLIAWAEELGLEDAIDLLEENLEEEKNADRLLTEIAEGDINEEAA